MVRSQSFHCHSFVLSFPNRSVMPSPLSFYGCRYSSLLCLLPLIQVQDCLVPTRSPTRDSPR